MQHGRGTYTWDDNSRYVGDWKEGKLDGRGVFTDSLGKVTVVGLRDALVHVVRRAALLVEVRRPAHLSHEHVLGALLLERALEGPLEDGLVHRDGALAGGRARSAHRRDRGARGVRARGVRDDGQHPV